MRIFLIIAGLALLFAFVGCYSDQPVSTTDANENNEVTGMTDELAAKMESYLNLDLDALPDLQRTPGNGNTPSYNDSIYDVYSIVILWGDLFDFGTNNPPVDWNGSLGVNGVAEVEASYSIAFEHGQDSIIVEDLPHTAMWVSETHHDIDGIHFTVYFDKTVVYITQPLLTLTTPLFTHSWDFEELRHLAEFYPVPPISGVAILSKQMIVQDCQRGTMNGTWHKDSLGVMEAHFSGMWVEHNGDTVGIFSGFVYTDTSGHQVLEGNISGLITDQIIGWLHGTWGYDDMRLCPACGEGHGYFMGVYHYDNSDVKGHFYGAFGDYSLPPMDLVMPMSGEWRQRCAHIDFDADDHDYS